MSATDHLNSAQFHTLKFGGSMEGEDVASVSNYLYKYDTERTRMLEEDVKAAGGITEPITVSPVNNEVRHGHHRVAVAYRLGISVPYRHGLDTGEDA